MEEEEKSNQGMSRFSVQERKEEDECGEGVLQKAP